MDAQEDRRHRTVRMSVVLVVGAVLVALAFWASRLGVGGMIERAANAAADSTGARMHAQIVDQFGAQIDSLGAKVDSISPRVDRLDSLYQAIAEDRDREP